MRVKASDWKNHDELLDSGSKGWHYQERLPELLKREIPELRAFEFGYCHEAELAMWISVGWRCLLRDDFEADEFNKVVGSRFQLTGTDSKLKIMDNYIMIRPLDLSEKMRRRRAEDAQATERAQIEGSSYLPPGLTSDDQQASLESTVVQTPKKAGRPPGSKNKKKG